MLSELTRKGSAMIYLVAILLGVIASLAWWNDCEDDA